MKVGDPMEKREKAKQDTLQLLKSINTIDDLKVHKDEILALIDDIFKFGMESLKNFFEGSLSPEKKQSEMAKFQDDNYFFDREIEKELDRIANLPGAEEYFESFKEEVEMCIQPHLEEFALQMAKFMGDLMGDMMGGMMEGMGDMMEGMNEFVEETESMHEDRKRSNELYFLYDVNSLEDLKKYKDDIIEILFEQLNSDLGELNDIKAVDFPLEEVRDRLDEIEGRSRLIESEFELEFKRIEDLPGVSEYAKSVKEEIASQMIPIMQEINELLRELNKTD
jgi:hypothetical protein